MSTICQRIEDALATDGARALRDDGAAQTHIAECESCFELLESTARLDEGLADLPVIDAPDETVARLLARPELLESAIPGATESESDSAAQRQDDGASADTLDGAAVATRRGSRAAPMAGRSHPSPWTIGLATAATLLLAVTVGVLNLRPASDLRAVAVQGINSPSAPKAASPPPGPTTRGSERAGGKGDGKDSSSMIATEETLDLLRSLGYSGDGASSAVEPQSEPVPKNAEPEPPGLEAPRRHPAKLEQERAARLEVDVDEAGVREKEKRKKWQGVASAEYSIADVDDLSVGTRFSDEFVTDLPVPGRFYQNVLTLAPGVQDADGDGNPNLASNERHEPVAEQGARSRDFKAVVSGISNVDPIAVPDEGQIDPDSTEETKIVAAGAAVESPRGQGGFARSTVDDVPDAADRIDASFDPRIAERFLAERSSLEDLEPLEPSGYWSNTYVPGDSELRLLQARLERGSPSIVGAGAQALHGAVRRTDQPFDAPRNAALQVYLHSDRRGADGRRRALVQVGLQATPRHGGRRPAMNVAVVLDLAARTPDLVAASMRSLATALAQQREPGDRFRLYTTGQDGRRPDVGPEEFSYGRVGLLMDELFSRPLAVADPSSLLVARTKAAIEAVAGADDPDATLGSSAVLVVTGSPLGSRTSSLERLAHQGALAGIPLSVVGVGSEVVPEEIDRLALAGQGQRRLLQSPADAPAAIERELAAASRAVARAVRLRIRLAPGVQLVDVVGSDRLDERAADRVRQSEQSLDLRLARNLGITADRGDDEDGIQIVIPNFYASDEHVILLDVVSPGAGPLVDVTARFKDLVHLKNGTVRASLSLDRGTDVQGRRELNVLKNYLAHLLSDTLHSAGNALARKDNASAEAQLLRHESFLAELSQLLPALSSDPEIRTDLAMLTSYRAALARSEMTPEQLSWLADSLRYASGARLHTPHPTERNPS